MCNYSRPVYLVCYTAFCKQARAGNIQSNSKAHGLESNIHVYNVGIEPVLNGGGDSGDAEDSTPPLSRLGLSCWNGLS